MAFVYSPSKNALYGELVSSKHFFSPIPFQIHSKRGAIRAANFWNCYQKVQILIAIKGILQDRLSPLGSSAHPDSHRINFIIRFISESYFRDQSTFSMLNESEDEESIYK